MWTRGGGVHFWRPPFGTLALWPATAGILIGIRLHRCTNKAQGFHWSWPKAICLPLYNTGAKKTSPISK